MEDVVGIIAVFVGLPWVVFSGIAKVKAAKAAEGVGMRASELDALVRRSVADAVGPLQRRIETLEAIATDDEPSRSRLDPGPLAADPLDPTRAERAPSRRARS